MTQAFSPLPPGRLYGTRLRGRDVPGFSLIETSYGPAHRIPDHAHERPYVCIVLAGAFTETSAGRSRHCGASTLVFHPSGEVHSDRFEAAGGRCLNLEIDAATQDHLRACGISLESSYALEDGRSRGVARRLYREFCQTDAASSVAIQGIALELLAGASRRTGSARHKAPPRWLAHVEEVLRADLTATPSLAQVAAEAGVHPVHLARTFRTWHGCSIGEYLRALRVEHARRLLTSSEEPLALVAAACGFYDQCHFSRTFKRLTGVSPATYRAAARAR